KRGIRRGEQGRAQHADQEHAQVGHRVLEQPPINGPCVAGRYDARSGRCAQGEASSWMVAILSWANPSRPATSMTVTTARCVVRASARMVMGPRSAPASL